VSDPPKVETGSGPESIRVLRRALVGGLLPDTYVFVGIPSDAQHMRLDKPVVGPDRRMGNDSNDHRDREFLLRQG
jgi:hypothetical protein